MEGKDLNSIDDVLPSQDDLADSTNILRVIGQTGNQDEADPDSGRTTALGDAITKINGRLEVTASDFLVCFGEARLYVQKDKIKVVQHLIITVSAKVTGGIDAGVDPHCFCTQDNSLGKCGLHEDLATGKRNSTVGRFKNPAVTTDPIEKLLI